jgi:hypothetical protein
VGIFEGVLRKLLADYGYQNIRTPIVETTPLFVRAIGEVTDVVEKEMYTFVDSLNGDSLTLRPEGTAGTLRAVVEHTLLYNTTQKLWYMGPMFRHEKPQKGRYRQFHQMGIEALGFAGPDIDAEIIAMTADLWQRLGLSQYVRLEINSLGNAEERAAHRQALIAIWKALSTFWMKTASAACIPTRCACWIPRTRHCRTWPTMRRACRIIWASLTRPLRGLEGDDCRAGHRLCRESSPGTWPGLLQPVRVRVGHPNWAHRARYVPVAVTMA